MVFEQGMRITPFVRPWLTMTINESCPFEGGRSVTRSTDSCLKGRVEDKGMGASVGSLQGAHDHRCHSCTEWR